ncbi:MAG: hypothetical protein HF962_00805 [Sulfurovum sp.]|nr:hypothetical protein [Sulfurovum sp.]
MRCEIQEKDLKLDDFATFEEVGSAAIMEEGKRLIENLSVGKSLYQIRP